MQSQIDTQKMAIISHLLDFDPRMIAFLFEPLDPPHLRESAGTLLEESWEFTSEQRVLIGASLDIWSGTGHVFLWELLNGLNEQSFNRFIAALVKWHDLKQPTHKKQPDDEDKIERFRPWRKKKCHPGYTIIPKHRLWIFEK
jgi:hypothetical protein